MDEKVAIKSSICKHQGQNIAKWREILGLTQEQLAERMKLTQNRISILENKETIAESTLRDIAEALGITVDLLKAYDHNSNICNYITYVTNNNTNNVSDVKEGGTGVVNSQIHPIEKIAELYERMLADKNDYIKKLETRLDSFEEKFLSKM
ncbi:helix-turn-helix protein [Dysgonomonas alginatilytica]|uniref:Helix-turn-helix protein n=1 Tax=Dysgonomonas alginatilytica TaxID=1605892 RepID=A0A2V3PPL2_9BACT|nr:helix-turn-helix transcriptional regulator [Dysgonomonas alginatilytica]PXV64439.1 helix-turn-helix protein [Dysgonomonas alginatilytica]